MPQKRAKITRSVDEAATAVRRGGVVVYPTDTVYGMGCDPFNEKAVAALFLAKGREDKPVPILCADKGTASRIALLGPLGSRFADAHWPGPLTLVVPLAREVPRMIDQGTGEVGVRVPGLPVAIDLIEECGGYLTGTSANVSGKPSCRSAPEAAAALGTRVDLILDGGPSRGSESTVLRIRGGKAELLRKGSLDLGDEVSRA